MRTQENIYRKTLEDMKTQEDITGALKTYIEPLKGTFTNKRKI